MPRAPLLAAILAGLAITPAAAQVKVLDEGSFTITDRGARIGREEFRIRLTPGPQGGLVVASATVAYDERRLVPILRTDSAGTPLEYMVEQRRGTRSPPEKGADPRAAQGPCGRNAIRLPRLIQRRARPPGASLSIGSQRTNERRCLGVRR